MEEDIKQRMLAIKMIVFDVDGVLTDGRIFKTGGGEEILAFNVRDGAGIARLKREGIEVALISGRVSGATMSRAVELGVEKVQMGKKEKGEAIDSLAEESGIDLQAMAFLGDDLLDIAAMKKVGLAVAVADAADEVKDAAHMVLDTPGGMGAARELAETVLKAAGRWKI